MPQTITIDGFGGGINARVPSVDIRDDEVVDALNMEIDGNRTLVTRPGLTSISAAYTFGSEDVIGLFHFRDSAGTYDQVIAAGASGIHKANTGTTSWSSIEGTPTVSTCERWEFASS